MSTAADQVFTTIENVDRRILGAFVCVDAITGLSVTSPIQVTRSGMDGRSNPTAAAYTSFLTDRA